MAINPKKVTKDKLIEMLTEERGKREALEAAENVLRNKLKKADERYEALAMIRDEKKRRISELESAVKAGQNRELDLRRKVDEFRDLYFEQCDKVKALREHPWKNLWSWLKGRFS